MIWPRSWHSLATSGSIVVQQALLFIRAMNHTLFIRTSKIKVHAGCSKYLKILWLNVS